MAEATLLIKKIPVDLKNWLAAEAQRNHRSMNKETISMLQEARNLRTQVGKAAPNALSVADILQAMHALPVLDTRTLNEMLYDKQGLPQ